VIGLVMTGLLPALSGCRVGLGTAVLASFAGQMVPFIGGALLTHALLSSRSGAYDGVNGAVVGERRRIRPRPAPRPLQPRAPDQPRRAARALIRVPRTLPA
jgi:hypothetical protein